MSLLNTLINGLRLGSVYAIIALGYTMVYGIAKMLNFAHGDVIMIGGYLCFIAANSLGLGTVPAVIIAMFGCTLLGIFVERLAYKPLRSASSLAVLITAIGVSYFLQNAALLIWGSDPKVFPVLIELPAVVQQVVQDIFAFRLFAAVAVAVGPGNTGAKAYTGDFHAVFQDPFCHSDHSFVPV